MKTVHSLLLIVFGISTIGLHAGTISGTVTNLTNNEALIGATVLIEGTTNGAVVDFDGNYSINNLETGTYTLICSFVSFTSDTVQVSVTNEETTQHNFSLSDVAIAIETFTVQAKAQRNSENYLLKVKQKSATVMEGISSQEIAKKGDGNAAGAIKRITGVTVEGGKYAYVRGLSDRYTKTTLNKSEIPSIDPNRNSIELDLFPTNMIDNMTVVKSFSPDLPGSFSGGLVNIETKEFPNQESFKVTTSIGFNPNTHFNNNFLSQPKSSTENFGFDNGLRDIPSAVKTQIPALFEDNEKLAQISTSFNKDMQPINKTVLFNHGHSATYGNKYLIKDNPLGIMAGISYKKSFQHLEEDAQTSRYELTGHIDETDQLNLKRSLSDVKSTESATIGGLVNVSYQIKKKHTVGATIFHTNNGIATTSFQEGEIPEEQVGLFYQTRAMTYKERKLTTYQGKGSHKLGEDNNIKIDWLSSFTNSGQKTPDQRYFSNDYTIDPKSKEPIYNLQAAVYSVPTRFFRYLEQSNWDNKVDVTIPLCKEDKELGHCNIIKFGGSALFQDRLMAESRYNYRSQGDLNYNGSIAEYIDDENMQLTGNNSGFMYIEDASEKRNSYNANQQIHAAYAMTDFWATNKLRIITGARFETTNIEVISFAEDQEKGSIQRGDLLPALNMTYELTNTQKLRFAYSRTIARPNFREIAPFASYDFATNWVIIGNPNLDRSLIDNLDLRYEIYPNKGEIIAVSAYYKNFTNPIEFVFNTKAANSELTWRNVANAKVYGLELEFKKELDFISTEVQKFTLSGNASYIVSEVAIDSEELELIRSNNPYASDKRNMFGQSPYVINASLGYSHKEQNFDLNINYNISGEKMAVVILGATPNIYTQPVHLLGFTCSKEIKEHFSVKLSANNLINPINKQTYSYKGDSYNFNSFRRGTLFTFGVSYQL